MELHYTCYVIRNGPMMDWSIPKYVTTEKKKYKLCLTEDLAFNIHWKS